MEKFHGVSNGRASWGILALLWFAYAINYIDRQMIFSMYPLLRREMGFSDAQLGLIGTLFLWVYSLCMPLAGRLADRVNKAHLILASVFLWSLATLGTSFSTSVSQLLSWRVAMGISEALYLPAAVGLIAALHPQANRSTALAIHQTAQFAGVVAGGWYGGWAADRLGFRAGFWIATAIGLLYAILLTGILGKIRTPAEESAPVAGDAIGAICNRRSVSLAVAFFAVCAMLWVFYAWYPNSLYERFHLSMTDSGLTATVFLQVSSAFGVIIGGLAGDRLARRRPRARLFLVAGGLFVASPFAFFAFSLDTLAASKACAAGFGLFSGMMIANTFSGAYDVVPRSQYSFAIGIINMTGGLAAGAAVLLAGFWKSSIGIPALMQISAAIAACAAIALSIALIRPATVHPGDNDA